MFVWTTLKSELWGLYDDANVLQKYALEQIIPVLLGKP